MKKIIYSILALSAFSTIEANAYLNEDLQCKCHVETTSNWTSGGYTSAYVCSGGGCNEALLIQQMNQLPECRPSAKIAAPKCKLIITKTSTSTK